MKMFALTDMEMDTIGELVERGFTNGRLGNLAWSIELYKHDWEDEEGELLTISEHIANGNTSGYYPSWKLKVNRIK